LKKTFLLKAEKIYVKSLKISDITNSYVKWLNDKEVNKFLLSGSIIWNIKLVERYVLDSINNQNEILFGIFKISDDKHIGNVRIHDINYSNSSAWIGIMIGDKSEWGNGYGLVILRLIIKFVFNQLKINILNAAVSNENKASLKTFKKAKFKIMKKFETKKNGYGLMMTINK
tara:strand:- start:115 stop:630 length:516 start_codon:yes stop_codon:yes gene_type:complete